MHISISTRSIVIYYILIRISLPFTHKLFIRQDVSTADTIPQVTFN